MTTKNLLIPALLLGLTIMSCTSSNKQNTESSTNETKTSSSSDKMSSYISMFEIPATDITRAINFYQNVLDIKIDTMSVEGMKIGVLPYEGQMVSGVIIQGEGYKPSADGVTIYLNAGDNLQTALDKVEKHGGKILMPKTAHADESGFFAVFLD